MANVTIQASLSYPHYATGTAATLSFALTQAYTAMGGAEFDFTGAETDTAVPFGSITSAKVLVAWCDTTGCTMKINGATQTIPVAGGDSQGFLLWCNPDGGVTAITVSTAGAAKVSVKLFA